MSKLLRIIIPIAVLIGLFGIAFNLIFGEGTVSFLVKENINGIDFYRFNIENYLANINISIGNPTALSLNMPPIQWSNDVIDNLKTILNVVILPLNVYLYPIKINAFVYKSLFTLIGVDFIYPTNNTQWLVNILNTLSTLQIPFIP